jgi:AcrR family transcriptional regulator
MPPTIPQPATAKSRARNDDDKHHRRQTIMDAAWDLFQAASYASLTMTYVAERCGLAKGTVYLYFKTKEALFLAVQEQQLQAWLDALDAALAAASAPDQRTRIALVTDLICDSVTARPALARLLTILHTVLEHNIEYETALAFKRMLLTRLATTGALLEACLPAIPAGEGARLLLRIYALIIGLYQLADPAPVARQVMALPELAALNVSFAPTFRDTLCLLLAGYADRAHSQDGAR